MLSPQQQQQFAREGYLVLPGFKPAAEVAQLLQRTHEILAATEAQDIGGSFGTQDPGGFWNRWFLDSDVRVRCFFEEEALDAQGRLNRPVPLAVNKIGHALHDLDPVFERFSHGPALAELAADLGLQEPQVWQSMLICKQPGIGGEVRWHQDATYLHCEHGAVIGFWFALEDADTDNGCLWVEPGGHHGPLRERFVREGYQTRLERLDETPWPDAGRARPLPCEAGSLVVFHGLLPHASQANRSGRSRFAYTLHASDARSGYARSNWIQRDASLPVRGFAAR
ncbi:MAG: phytanoyl-CoA dioxygenase family protein [Rubrivivax sp.]|nr:phytanoyl-CoA dioxygenase family protein [Rubrivivax sp.]